VLKASFIQGYGGNAFEELAKSMLNYRELAGAFGRDSDETASFKPKIQSLGVHIHYGTFT
jgi:hypothetical protein